jgi:hypothetical protein
MNSGIYCLIPWLIIHHPQHITLMLIFHSTIAYLTNTTFKQLPFYLEFLTPPLNTIYLTNTTITNTTYLSALPSVAFWGSL